MAMQQCPNGHLYDDSKNSSCPYCGGANTLNVTMPLGDAQHTPQGNVFPTTVPLDNQYIPPQPQVIGKAAPVVEEEAVIPVTKPVGPAFVATTYKEDIINEHGILPILGWLICLKGSKKGVDFKLHGEKNTIGRGGENDVNLDFDTSISSGVNAIIAYDNRNNKFYLYQSNSKNNIYFNDSILLTPVEIKDYDVMEIGSTKLVFRSLCNEYFTWQKEEEGSK